MISGAEVTKFDVRTNQYLTKIDLCEFKPVHVRRIDITRKGAGIDVYDGYPTKDGDLVNLQCPTTSSHCHAMRDDGRMVLEAAKRLIGELPDHFKSDEVQCTRLSRNAVTCELGDDIILLADTLFLDGKVDGAAVFIANDQTLGAVAIGFVPVSMINGAQEMFDSAR